MQRWSDLKVAEFVESVPNWGTRTQQ